MPLSIQLFFLSCKSGMVLEFVNNSCIHKAGFHLKISFVKMINVLLASKRIVLFTNFQASFYGSPSDGARKKVAFSAGAIAILSIFF